MSNKYSADYYNTQETEYPPGVFPESNAQAASKLRVKRMLMIPTGTYNDQYNRPFVTNYNMDNRNEMAEVLGRSYFDYQQKVKNGQLSSTEHFSITPELISGATSSFLQPSARVESAVAIPNGWGNTRARFVLEIETERVGAGKQEFIILGYTDHYGISTGGHIDPRLEFTINAIYETRQQQYMTNFGMQSRTILSNASQVLANERFNGDIHYNVKYNMRPQDVIATINVQHIPELVNGSIMTVDSRTRGTSKPVKSDYGHANPSNYLATILGGLTSGIHQAELTNRHGDTYDFATAIVADNNVNRDPFLRAMSGVTNAPITNKFLFRDLCELDPNAARDEVTAVFQREAATLIGIANRPGEDYHLAGSTSHWQGEDRPTLVATKIANALPHLMVEMLIQSCTIHSTNNVVGSQPTTVYSNVIGLVRGVDMAEYAEQLKRNFINGLLADITFNFTIGYELMVSASIVGDIWISLNLEGFPAVDYVAPAFANSLSSPVMTRNMANLNQLASDFSQLQTEVFPSNLSGQTPTNQFWTPGAGALPSGKKY